MQQVVPRRLEPRTLRLLAVRSNQLSYETPEMHLYFFSHMPPYTIPSSAWPDFRSPDLPCRPEGHERQDTSTALPRSQSLASHSFF